MILICSFDRCRPRNLFLCGIHPGPGAPDSKAVQYVLAPIVDELLVLYREGVVIKTERFPEGKAKSHTSMACILSYTS